MSIDISTIANLIGIIGGAIFYLDGWGSTPGKAELSKTRRYKGFATVIGGGILSPFIDRLILGNDRYEFFLGYLFGVGIGWLLFFTAGLLLYVIWNNTRGAKSKVWVSAGDISYSMLEIIAFGITESPRLKAERIKRAKIEDIKTKNEILKLNDRLKENPTKYIEFEEQQLQREQSNLEKQRQDLESLKSTVQRVNNSPAAEAEQLITLKISQIQTLQDELELAHKRYDEDRERMQVVIDKYNTSLVDQEKLKGELQKALDDFRNARLSKSDLARIVTYQRINQYEAGGLFIGKLTVKDRLIRIYHGNIINLTTDVIVSSDDNYLSMGGGVSGSIRYNGGEVIFREAQMLVPLRLGDVVVTAAGQLTAKKIFHGVLIDFDDNKGPTKEAIQQVVHSSIVKANNYGFTSISFPLLGTGAGGFPIITALEIMLFHLIQELSTDQQSVNEVIIALYGNAVEVIDLDNLIQNVQLQTS